MKKSEALNTFSEGIIMDLNPEVTPNTTMTNALNATLVTMNGNEDSLQNDMGNVAVPNACLPEGYVPVGTAELGGIIYIASYNPLTQKSQIGSFPSPQRLSSTDENTNDSYIIKLSDFTTDNVINKLPILKSQSTVIKLAAPNGTISAGDKYAINMKILDSKDNVQTPSEIIPNNFTGVEGEVKSLYLNPKYINVRLGCQTETGSITYFDDDLVWYDFNSDSGSRYYINTMTEEKKDEFKNMSEYRNNIESNFNIFNSKESGNLIVEARLECIDNFEFSYDLVETNVEIKTEVETESGTEIKTETRTDYTIYGIINWTNDDTNIKTITKSEDSIVSKTINNKNKINPTAIAVEYNTIDSEGKKITNYKEIHTHLANKDGSSYTLVNPLPDKTLILSPKDYSVDEFIKTKDWKNYYIGDERKNDGTDTSLIINLGTYQKASLEKMTIYPGHSFGYLDWLKKTIKIDVDKIGTGEFYIDGYQYTCSEKETTVNFKFINYPKTGDPINSINIDYMPFNSNDIIGAPIMSLSNAVWENKSIDNYEFLGQNVVDEFLKNYYIKYHSDDPEGTKFQTIWKSFTDSVTDIGYGKEISIKKELDDYFKYKQLYLIRITVNYNDKQKCYYRILFNNGFFNGFVNNDYKDITLDEVLPDQLYYINAEQPKVIQKSSTIKPVASVDKSDGEKSEIINFKYKTSFTVEYIPNQILNSIINIGININKNEIFSQDTLKEEDPSYLYNKTEKTNSHEITCDIESNLGIPELKNNKYTIEISDNVNCKYLYDYTDPYTFASCKFKSGTDYETYYLGTQGQEDGMAMGLSTADNWDTIITYDQYSGDDDKCRKTGTIGQLLPNIKKELGNIINLSSFKVIPLIFKMTDYTYGSKHDRGRLKWLDSTASDSYFCWQQGTTVNVQSTGVKNENYPLSYLYAVKDISDKISLLVYVRKSGVSGYTKNYPYVYNSTEYGDSERDSFLKDYYAIDGMENKTIYIPSYIYGHSHHTIENSLKLFNPIVMIYGYDIYLNRSKIKINNLLIEKDHLPNTKKIQMQYSVDYNNFIEYSTQNYIEGTTLKLLDTNCMYKKITSEDSKGNEIYTYSETSSFHGIPLDKSEQKLSFPKGAETRVLYMQNEGDGYETEQWFKIKNIYTVLD